MTHAGASGHEVCKTPQDRRRANQLPAVWKQQPTQLAVQHAPDALPHHLLKGLHRAIPFRRHSTMTVRSQIIRHPFAFANRKRLSSFLGMASNLRAIASNLRAMASNLRAMASSIQPYSNIQTISKLKGAQVQTFGLAVLSFATKTINTLQGELAHLPEHQL